MKFFCVWCGQPTELQATCCSYDCEDALAAYNNLMNNEMASYDEPHIPFVDPKDAPLRNEMCEVSSVAELMSAREYTEHCERFRDYWERRRA